MFNLNKIGTSKKLIIKPSSGARGIWIIHSTPTTINKTIEKITNSCCSKYVIQDLIENPILYEGKKNDLRVFALVTSFQPLKFKIYKEGLVRIAAKKYSRENSHDPLISITGTSFQMRQSIKPETITITKLLKYLKKRGYEIEGFWIEVKKLLEKVFKCLVNYCIKNKVNFANRFYFSGIDLMLEKTNNSYRILFIETNYTPSLRERCEKEVDMGFRFVHKQ